MMRDESAELLRRYSEERSEAAFRELVRQHSGLVYGTALRKLGGDRAAAQDVMQEVFTGLVRKAPALGNVVLAGWLYRQTCRQAANHVRAESRRRKRELVAVEAMADPHAHGPGEITSSAEVGEEMDRALLALPGADRDALVLRYFEGHDYRRVGAAQGITEEAARKRVSRALEKLAAVLRKNGVLTTGGAVSLSGTMSGMAATTAVPEAVISRVAGNALKAAPAGGLTALPPLLKSFLAGLLMTSAAAKTLVASRNREATVAAATMTRTTAATVKREALEPVYLKPVPGDLSPEQLIAEIKKLKAAPAHILTKMRMELLLSSIPLDQVPAFFALAAGQLTRAEKRTCYQPLLERWMKQEPEAAMSCIFNDKIALQLDPAGKSSLVVTIYERWLWHDSSAAEKWLLREWANPNLGERGFETTFRTFMAMGVVDWLIGNNRQDEAFQFVAAISSEKDQAEVLAGAAGGSPWNSSSQQIEGEQRIELYRRLLGFADPRLGRRMAHTFWKKRRDRFPSEVAALEGTLKPAENFDLTLIALELGNSGRDQSADPAADFRRLTEAASQSGSAAGLPRQEVLQQIGESIVSSSSGIPRIKQALAWIDAHSGELNLDDLLADKLARQFSGWVEERDEEERPHGFEFLLWASRIGDPERRLRLCRGTFRQILLLSDETLVRKSLGDDAIPADLRTELQTLLHESP